MKTCPQCNSQLDGNTPEGLCPRCLASAAMHTAATRISGTPADLPDIGNAADVAARLPQYEILSLLGRGGMGVVYKARQRQLDRIVALKILPPADALSPDFVARFRREAQSLAKLNHPNIVAVHDFGESGGLYFFAMEFVDGVNLREVLRAKKFTAAEALAVVPKICEALQFAHDEGVVHRDIKPENLLVDAKGRVKIADFGLAKLLRREQTDHTLTMTGMTLGTPRYMAPEQLDKPETVDHRADIYSLGVVFYEMLTGEVPMGRFAPPSEKVRIDVRLDEIVLHALERDVERRYQHASEVRDDVERVTSKPQIAPGAVASPPPVSAIPAPSPVASAATSAKHRISAGLIVACVLGIVGCLWPIAVEEPGFWGFSGMDSQEFARPADLMADTIQANSPAAVAGVRPGDRILTVRGQWATLRSLDDIWKQTPVGTEVEIKVLRDKQELLLHTVRGPVPVSMRYYAWWQFIARFPLLLSVGLVVLAYLSPRLHLWRGVLVGLLGLGLLVYLVAFPSERMWKLVWQEISVSDSSAYSGLGQKLAVGIGALGLLLLGAVDFLRVFGRPTTGANEIKPGAENVTQSVPAARAPGAWTRLEIAAIATTALAFVLGGVNALFDLAQNRSPMHGATTAAILLAAACSAALMIAQQFRPSANARAALPGLHFTVLAACTGSLPWTWVLGDITGWNFWHGAAFAALNFVLALVLLITPGGRGATWRDIAMLLAGLAGLALVLWWNAVPVTLIGDRGGFLGSGSGPMTINRKPALAGAWTAIALAVLTAIAGALQLRAASKETP